MAVPEACNSPRTISFAMCTASFFRGSRKRDFSPKAASTDNRKSSIFFVSLCRFFFACARPSTLPASTPACRSRASRRTCSSRVIICVALMDPLSSGPAPAVAPAALSPLCNTASSPSAVDGKVAAPASFGEALDAPGTPSTMAVTT